MGIAEPRKRYAHLIHQRDDDAGGIVLDTLKEQGLSGNTIVCFTSDNGGVSSGDADSTNSRPLRSGKGRQSEDGIREPFSIKAPGHHKSRFDLRCPGQRNRLVGQVSHEKIPNSMRPSERPDGNRSKPKAKPAWKNNEFRVTTEAGRANRTEPFRGKAAVLIDSPLRTPGKSKSFGDLNAPLNTPSEEVC